MEPTTDPGATTSPVEPAVTTAPVQTTPANGSEPVTNTDGKTEQQVPFSRFQEVNDKAKQADERVAQLESELETERQAKVQQTSSEDELDPEVLDLVKKSSAKLGLVSKEELDAREAQIQVRQDLVDLTSQYKDFGIPFDGK